MHANRRYDVRRRPVRPRTRIDQVNEAHEIVAVQTSKADLNSDKSVDSYINHADVGREREEQELKSVHVSY